jgi:hypothetical protein
MRCPGHGPSLRVASIDEMGSAVGRSYVRTGSTFGYCDRATYLSWDNSVLRDCSQELAHLYCFEVAPGR